MPKVEEKTPTRVLVMCHLLPCTYRAIMPDLATAIEHSREHHRAHRRPR